jgi:hypothetical protein
MAFVSKQDKADLAPTIKAVLKKHGMKGTISIRHMSTLVVKVSGGAIDFSQYLENAEWPREEFDVNDHWIDRTYAKDLPVKNFLNELHMAMRGPDWYNNSDAMTDYFDISHYTTITIGSYKKPYKFVG